MKGESDDILLRNFRIVTGNTEL